MKKIMILTTVLMFLLLWGSLAPAADPLPKSKASPAPQEPSASVPLPQKPTTPGVVTQAAFADLAVTEIVVQEVGQGALIKVTVKNLGTASADATLYKLRVLLDGNSLPGGDQPLFNTRSPIRPGQVRVTGLIPSRAGRIEVTARLILSGAAVSDKSANNILTHTLDIPEVRPDFTITKLALLPDNRIQVTIRNNGGYAPGDHELALEILANNDSLRHSGEDEWPNPSETIIVDTHDPIVGTRRVRATINPSRSVLEMNYENNVLSKEFTAHVLKPDLRVLHMTFWGEPNYKLKFRVSNEGDAASPRTMKADVFEGNELIGTYTLEGPIAEHSLKDFTMFIPIVRGRQYRVTVDPRNEIDEERENNNSLTATPLPERRR